VEIFTSTETMVDHPSPTHPTHPTHPAHPKDATHPSPTHPSYACRMLQLTPLS